MICTPPEARGSLLRDCNHLWRVGPTGRQGQIVAPFARTKCSTSYLKPLLFEHGRGPFTQVTLLWSSGAAPSDDVGLVHWHCRRGTCAARDQHAVDLPGDVALETADDLSLALALLCAP